MSLEKEIEVYNYVVTNIEYMDTIIRALVMGTKQKNEKLYEDKSYIEVGLISLMTSKRTLKLTEGEKLCVERALKLCTAFKTDSLLKMVIPKGGKNEYIQRTS